ncbi:SigE family RNA polymerase sigma factor [Cellulomonas sp. Root137]|uniref:SigE family RNA polymerase sigma factor n=1 Tax=Cellulomonas sp. Root137 TaxID=1736459 RepID=UPI0009E6B165|nr:SigE family RNA polymerase sigma factor [Cellulomonas sp. Root137]
MPPAPLRPAPPDDDVGEESTRVLTGRTRPAEDTDAEFTAFMQAHSADLLRTAWLLVGDAHRAEELVQHALVRTYAAWSRARRDDPLAYARRTLVNLRIDTWRRRRREVLSAPEHLPETGSIAAHGPSDDRDQLVRALALLSPRQRRIVVLRHFVGLPEAEVAAELGVSVGTVKSTASRGLATLRTALTTERSAR